MISFSNDELADLPVANIGQEINCPHCDSKHTLVGGAMSGEETVVLFYKCGENIYLTAVDGKRVSPHHNRREEDVSI